MRLQFTWLFRVAFAAAWLSGAGAAAANPSPGGGLSLGVAPVSINLPVGTDTASTMVSNPGAEPVTIQVRLYGWTTEGADDVYKPTHALGFSPAVFRLTPGAHQLVRLLLLQPPADTEGAYRLVVDQLPLTSPTGGLQMPVRMLLPVFVAPRAVTTPQAAQLDWEASYGANHTVRLTVRNLGSKHAKITDLAYTVGGASHDIRKGLAGYALASQSRSWTFAVDQPPQTLTVTAHTDSSPIRVDVVLAH